MLSILAAYSALALPSQVQYLTKTFVDYQSGRSSVTISDTKTNAPIVVDSKSDWPGVVRVAKDLQKDLNAVTGKRPFLVDSVGAKTKVAIILGTIGKSTIIDGLVKSKKLNVDGVLGKWESYVIQTVKNPWPGLAEAVVIAGSDKRGTIYGAYEMSEQSGVSPWSWWADVPVKHHPILAIKQGRFVQSSPAVKYRGIFINDEAPSLSNWVYKNFGEYKHEFYVHVFELLLRLRANYLWPAMWNNCFNEDDPLNPKLADEYGVVMGTSHVEPMGRADKEWNRLGFKPEQWNYLKNPNELEKFWADGVRRNKPYETITTMAMRGKVDTPMSEDENISLLEKIVASQRKILAKEVNPDVTKVPQLWCLYKEVQNYYDKGMRVPDDVTLLWADDNWGNIRRLPTPEERHRSGGAGVYYHFDYVGGPRNYKWVNTNPLPRIWEQMHMAYERGADRIWIVNVGDIKPMEFPTEFFIRMGWDPDRWNASNLHEYGVNWATRDFGPDHASLIEELLSSYAKILGRRKPELLDSNTYSLVNYDEALNVVRWTDYNQRGAKQLLKMLPEEQRDAFYQLVYYPVVASDNLHKLYLAAGMNRLYAAQGRNSANTYADLVKEYFDRDKELQTEFHTIHGGKWDHMMDQTHIGYTNWQQPDQNNIPQVVRVHNQGPYHLGLSVEGNSKAITWPQKETPVTSLLSAFESRQPNVELFNTGSGQISFSITSSEPWIKFSNAKGDVGADRRIYISADWTAVPPSCNKAIVTIKGSDGSELYVEVPVRPLTTNQIDGFTEGDGYISIEAGSYKKKYGSAKAKFVDLPDLGRTKSAVTIMPTTAPKLSVKDNVRLDYPFYTFHDGPIKVQMILSPTQLLQPTTSLQYALSIDDGPPVTVNMHENYVYFAPSWEASVAQNAIIKTTPFTLTKPGRHTLHFYAIDPGVVLQKIVIDTGGLKPSYLGPPESVYVEKRKPGAKS